MTESGSGTVDGLKRGFEVQDLGFISNSILYLKIVPLKIYFNEI